MNYQDAEIFLTIVSTKSITKAAEQLFLSQPTISHRLNLLERELGVALIVRQKGHKVAIEGKLQLDQWQDKDGAKRSKHSISVESFEFLEPKGSQPQPQQDEYKAHKVDGISNPPMENRQIDNQDWDIPFKRG